MENNMHKNKAAVWIVVGVLVVILIAVFAFNNKGMRSDDTNGDTQSVVEPESTEDTTEGSVNTPKTTSGTQAVTMSYQKALETYKDKRIQFNNMCQAFPNNVTYKNGTTIMIDNRSPQAITVKLPSAVSVKGYGFKIVKLSSSTLPRTILVDCGAQQNVATILLQK